MIDNYMKYYYNQHVHGFYDAEKPIVNKFVLQYRENGGIKYFNSF